MLQVSIHVTQSLCHEMKDKLLLPIRPACKDILANVNIILLDLSYDCCKNSRARLACDSVSTANQLDASYKRGFFLSIHDINVGIHREQVTRRRTWGCWLSCTQPAHPLQAVVHDPVSISNHTQIAHSQNTHVAHCLLPKLKAIAKKGT